MGIKTLTMPEDALVNMLKTLPEDILIDVFWRTVVEAISPLLPKEKKNLSAKASLSTKKAKPLKWQDLS